MQIRDRIVELRRVRAKDLIPHPRNWRTHPKRQQEALRGILAEVGYPLRQHRNRATVLVLI